LDEARAAASKLVQDGFLEVTRGEWRERGVMHEHAVARGLWAEILNDDRNWGTSDVERDARSRDPRFRLAGTEAATRAWIAYAERNGLIGFTAFDRLARRVKKRAPARASDIANPS
jgi:hypothetical protein